MHPLPSRQQHAQQQSPPRHCSHCASLTSPIPPGLSLHRVSTLQIVRHPTRGLSRGLHRHWRKNAQLVSSNPVSVLAPVTRYRQDKPPSLPTARCAPGGEIGFQSQQDRGKYRRGQTPGCSTQPPRGGNAQTWNACRRTQCRIRRLQSQSSRPAPVWPTHQSHPAHRQSKIRGSNPPAATPRPTWNWCWFCHAYPPQPTPCDRAKCVRQPTAGHWCKPAPGSKWLPSAGYRVKPHCQLPTGQA